MTMDLYQREALIRRLSHRLVIRNLRDELRTARRPPTKGPATKGPASKGPARRRARPLPKEVLALKAELGRQVSACQGEPAAKALRRTQRRRRRDPS